jgi:hypothetical protein
VVAVRASVTVLVPPLVMAVLLFVPRFGLTLNATQLAAAIVFLVLFCFVFLWGCVWLSARLSRFLGITGFGGLLLINASVQFLLTEIGSISTDLAMHAFSWSQALRDGLEQTSAFVVAYLVYHALRRQTLAPAHPAPNNRWRGP